MSTKFVFDIPIYRVSPEDYSQEIAKLLEKETSPEYWCEEWGIDIESLSEEQVTKITQRLVNSFNFRESSPQNRCWKYNELIGFINIVVGKFSLKGECWFIDSKRISKVIVRKTYEYRDKAFEVWILANDSSRDILRKIYECLEEVKKRKPFKSRYLDLEAFDNISPFIDWKLLSSIDKKNCGKLNEPNA